MLVDFEITYFMHKEWADTFNAISESKESSADLNSDDVLEIITSRMKAYILSSGELP